MRYGVFWRHHAGGSIWDPSIPSLRDQQCDSCSWPTHVPTEKREHVMRVWTHCDEGVNTLWWGCEHTVMRVWIHCDEGVNTLWWGCEWCVNEERCMKSCTYLMYDIRSFEVSIYLWHHHANLCNKHITSKWFLLREKSYVLGYKICQFFVLWVGGLQGHMSALLLTGCSPSLILSLPSAIITIFLSVALIYVSSVLPI